MDPVIASKISACQTYLSAFDKAMADAGNTTKSNDQAVTMTKNDAIEIALASGGAVASIKAVPVAMSMFGKIVSGVGTLHASKAAGGLAATLQSSAFLPCLLAVSSGYLLYKICSLQQPAEDQAKLRTTNSIFEDQPHLKRLASACKEDYARAARK